MICLENVSKNFGKVKALDNVSFSFEKGSVTGFIGPNGAGKSTVMNIISGFIPQTSGTVTVDGINISENPIDAKRKIGYLPEKPPLYTSFTVYEYLKCIYDIKGLKLKKDEHIKEVASLSGISEVMGRRTANLSSGYRQRVGVAYAILGYPDYIILDEPTNGLDPKQKRDLLMLIKKLSKKHGILLSSHILSEIEAVCTDIVMINNGKTVGISKNSHSTDIEKMFMEGLGDK